MAHFGVPGSFPNDHTQLPDRQAAQNSYQVPQHQPYMSDEVPLERNGEQSSGAYHPPPQHSEQQTASRSRRSKHTAASRDRKDESIEDVYVAVMGVTGSGKSSYIELCTGRKVGVGDSLLSETQEVGEFSFMFKPNMRVHLIDTPGFDDSGRKDAEVLRDIAGYLGIAYKKKILLSGIIYLHRIIDPRMAGSARRNLSMFRELCGSDCYGRIALVTTCWSLVPPEVGARREKELIDTEDFWGHMYSKGSNILRHTSDKDRSSALAILDTIIHRRETVTLQIQREMNDGLKLEETGAGQQLNADIIEERERHRKDMKMLEQEMKDALKTRDSAQAAFIADLQAQTEKKIRAGEESQQRLQTDLKKLQAEREAAMLKLEAEVKETNNKYMEEQRKLRECNKENEEKFRSLQEESQRTKEQLAKQLAELARKGSGSQTDWGSLIFNVLGKGLDVVGFIAGAAIQAGLDSDAAMHEGFAQGFYARDNFSDSD